MLSLFLLLGCLLHPDHHSIHHPGLLHRAHRQPAAEEDGGGAGQAAEGRVCGDVRGGGVLCLLPPLRCRQSGAPERAPPDGAERRGHRGPGLRWRDGPVLHGLPARPAGLLLLQLRLQGHLHFNLLPRHSSQEAA